MEMIASFWETDQKSGRGLLDLFLKFIQTHWSWLLYPRISLVVALVIALIIALIIALEHPILVRDRFHLSRKLYNHYLFVSHFLNPPPSSKFPLVCEGPVHMLYPQLAAFIRAAHSLLSSRLTHDGLRGKRSLETSSCRREVRLSPSCVQVRGCGSQRCRSFKELRPSRTWDHTS